MTLPMLEREFEDLGVRPQRRQGFTLSIAQKHTLSFAAAGKSHVETACLLKETGWGCTNRPKRQRLS